mgnify:CR=1 FL=1
MIWLDTKTPAEAECRRTAMWGIVRTDAEDGGMTAKVNGEGLYEDGRFWADALKAPYDDPPRLLKMAKQHMPLPAAFREACIALRAIIRTKKKADGDFDADLRELHYWAAVQSIACYDELDITPYASIASLDLTPAIVGWEHLPLLNKSDGKQMSELWPAPARHTTGAALYPEVERTGRQRLEEHREADRARRMEQFHAEIDAALAGETSVATDRAITDTGKGLEPKRRGLLAWIFGR